MLVHGKEGQFMKIKSNIAKVLIPILAIVLIFVGHKLTNQKIVEKHTVYQLHNSFDTLLAQADTIVIGRVINVDNGFIVDQNKYVTGKKAKEAASKLGPRIFAYTPVKIKVEQVIRGNISEGDMIRINQEGGTYENVYYKIEGNEIYKNQEEYVFFLRKVNLKTEQKKKDFKDDFYLPINPFQGQLKIESNIVLINPEINPMYNNDKMSKNDFIDLIKSHLK